MAFIFEAERKGNVLKSEVPGPGQYFGEANSRTPNRGFAPFLSTVERNVAVIKKNPTKQELPGPGAYDTGLCISNSLKPSKAFHSTLVPEKEHNPQVHNSTVFKSKTKRFEHKIETDMPGPGKYYKDKGFIKAATATNLGQTKSANTLDIRVFTKDNRLNVPSIPSYVHSYGYTEAENKKLNLNQNPLIEIQQFVGPGYYDMKDQFTPDSNKGTTWYKSTGKRFESTALKHSVTKLVGPGSYDIKNMEGAEPMYKTKATSGFASTTNRNFLGMDLKPRTSPRKTNEKVQFEIGLAKPDTVVSDNNNREHFVDPDHGPGPGYYYNEMNSTTLKLSYKPTKLQFFGSGTERFKENYDNMLGPGDYNVEDAKGKKSKVKAAFLSNEKRLKIDNSDALGPGQYETRTTLVDRVKEKAKRGYLGSFGSTELRFKPPKTEEETNEKVEFFRPPPVNPRPEPIQDEPKNTHVFQSKIEKFPVATKFETPPPGTYDVHNFDIAKKIMEGINPLYTAKKAPFNNSETRFKNQDRSVEKRRHSPEDAQMDEYLEKKRAISYKPGVKQVSSSAFASKTNRSLNSTAQNIPGPGSYQHGANQDGWNKKTYNIKYLEERGK